MSEETESSAVALEVAEAEFDRFVEAMDLDVDPDGMNGEERVDFARLKRRFVTAMQRGTLVVNGDGCPVFTPKSGGAAITFHEPDGAALMAMDQRKKGHDMGKLIAVMAAITRQPANRFAKMPKRDLDICIAITNLFLG